MPRAEKSKLCHGPAHDVPTLLPATEKYFYVRRSKGREGELYHRCRLCANWERLKSPGTSGYVPLHVAFPFFREAVNRVGIVEAARRMGMSHNGLREILNAPPSHRVQKAKLRSCMLEVISMRRKGEVRHKDSIEAGAYLRGWSEKIPKGHQDLYRRHGSRDTEYKRKSRRLAS
jgi:hypothetical protein